MNFGNLIIYYKAIGLNYINMYTNKRFLYSTLGHPAYTFYTKSKLVKKL